MTMYWMLNSQWPNFFGHIIDYYLKPGGAYFGAKKGLTPVNIVYDYYGGGDRTKAKVFVVNQTLKSLSGLEASVSFIDLDGNARSTRKADGMEVPPNSSVTALEVARIENLPGVFFVRCQLRDRNGRSLADNVYWDSTSEDVLVPPDKEKAFDSSQIAWADLTPLNSMKPATVAATGRLSESDGWITVKVLLRNKSSVPGFFLRAEITNSGDGDEILPVTWSDNYVTIFGGESMTLEARFRASEVGHGGMVLRVGGHNVPAFTEKLQAAEANPAR
jgi:exo-1,4-beta-D-glucosaminidase